MGGSQQRSTTVPGVSAPLVYIKWLDSLGAGSGWQPIGDLGIDRPLEARSVGWMVRDTPEAIVIVPHLIGDCGAEGVPVQGCGDMTIPKVAIQEFILLGGSHVT